jgi:hypothetical protein
MRTIFLLLPLVFFVACTNQKDKDRIAELEKQVKELKEQSHQQQKSAGLDSQQQCSEGAHKTYISQGWDKPEKGAFNSYTNHFNENLNRCFIEINSSQVMPSEGRIFSSRQLSDAFEGKMYSEIYINKLKTDLPGSLPVFKCDLTSLTGESKSCSSVAEYEHFIKQYME